MMLIFIDLIIAITILLIAILVIFSKSLLNSIIYFIAFGLLVALAWVRLNAPDVAIAEAAIGAGLTGALFLVTWKRISKLSVNNQKNARISVSTTLTASALSIFLVIFLVYSALSIQSSKGLTYQIASALHISGVTNPVTAVLLNFRSFDTLLEIGVLFLTIVAIRALSIDARFVFNTITSTVFLRAILRVLVPLSILFGAYLLWIGSSEPGGAFQAGALWGGALILLKIANPEWIQRLHVKSMLVVGLGVFILAALLSYFLSGNILMYPTDQAYIWILLIETAASISIAFILFELFCVSPAKKPDEMFSSKPDNNNGVQKLER